MAGRWCERCSSDSAPIYALLNYGPFGGRCLSSRVWKRSSRSMATSVRLTHPTLRRRRPGGRRASAGGTQRARSALGRWLLLSNAITAVNVILRNLCYSAGDAVLYPQHHLPVVVSGRSSPSKRRPRATSHCIYGAPGPDMVQGMAALIVMDYTASEKGLSDFFMNHCYK